MLTLQGVTYVHSDGNTLFSDIQLTINRRDKIALIGNNGSGKSTLLQILAGERLPAAGKVKAAAPPYYLPQLFTRFHDQTVAQALQVAHKLTALRAILNGNATDAHLLQLDDDWTIEERCREALAYWNIGSLDLTQEMHTLSGGQKTKVFLAGIAIHQPEIVLLDEPSNHLDTDARNLLYDYIRASSQTLVVVSHDRALLHLLDTVYELDKRGIKIYGGNYDFYEEQKAIENSALHQELKDEEKALRKARETEREALERQQKLDARGKKKQEQAGLPTISMNTFRNNAEKSTSRMQAVHAGKVQAIGQRVAELRKEMPDTDKMKMNLDHSMLHDGKILITAKDLQFGYGAQLLWEHPLNFQIVSGERISITGANGSGKTTLLNMILGTLRPRYGTLNVAAARMIYLDQEYSLVNNDWSVYEQAQRFHPGGLQEHEIKIRLTRFLFTKADWDKPCSVLSGGEKMRLMLCCLTISGSAPDIIVLDEPTNNLDIRNMGILSAALNDYRGTLLVVSHDMHFLKQINVGRSIHIA